MSILLDDASHPGLPRSILDTDLYKLSMQQAILSLKEFKDLQCTYRFNHRDKDVYFTKRCADLLKQSVDRFSELALRGDELEWLRSTCPYFTPHYLEYLSKYRFKPEQVTITFVAVTKDGEQGHIEIEAHGLWCETILWEVPLMACLSEVYFQEVSLDWDHSEEKLTDITIDKAKGFYDAGCTFSEFGTRRRRSYRTQDLVVQILKDEYVKHMEHQPNSRAVFSGTSNVHLAHKHDLKVIGTIAHEWFMAVGAIFGYEHANSRAMDLWEGVYGDKLLIALTDTFSSKAFFQDFDFKRAAKWIGLRQDSGDPLAFARSAKQVYDHLAAEENKRRSANNEGPISLEDKTVIFSDALTLEKAAKLQSLCDELGLKASYGVGTYLTNDFDRFPEQKQDGKPVKSKALNMVIKLSSIDNKPCVKISDDLTKNTGDSTTVNRVKDMFGLQSSSPHNTT